MAEDSVEIELNGEPRRIPPGLTVAGLLEHLELKPGTIVVEHNRTILRRNEYRSMEVKPGDSLELVHFVGGG